MFILDGVATGGAVEITTGQVTGFDVVLVVIVTAVEITVVLVVVVTAVGTTVVAACDKLKQC